MSKIIIADTSCFIALDGIGQLQILQKLFSRVTTTQEISDEYGKKMPDWIVVKPVNNSIQKGELERILDKGEASAIALALENISETILIMDEKKGRRIAKEYHLEVIGTLKVLLLAKQKGFISSVRDQISLLSVKKFHFDQAIVQRILMESGELN